jgi:raffinose/stachyose/melibiose transport system permease protein
MRKNGKKVYSLTDIVYTVPTFLIFLIVIFVPLFISFFSSFTSWNGVSGNMRWIGTANYRRLFDMKGTSWTALLFSFRFTFVCVILTNLIAFALALALTGKIRSASALRVVFFLPNLIGGLILGFIWRFIFLKVFSAVGAHLPIPFFSLPWLGTPATGFWASVIVFLWRNVGYIMLIYIAGINGIDKSILESAVIDGAGFFRSLVSIKMPLIVPAFTASLFLMISNAFKLFDIIFSLTGGGPYGSTESFAFDIYCEAFKRNNYGFGSAKAVVFFGIVAAISLLQVYVTKRKEVSYE